MLSLDLLKVLRCGRSVQLSKYNVLRRICSFHSPVDVETKIKSCRSFHPRSYSRRADTPKYPTKAPKNDDSSNHKEVPDTNAARTQAITDYYAQYEKEFQQLSDDIGVDFVEMDDQSELVQSKFPISLDRGLSGVFDVEELVELVQYERGEDIVTIGIDPAMHYAHYMVIVTCRSVRQMRAMEEKIVRLYKLKKGPEDPFLHLEDRRKRSNTWRVIDMGNIVTHLMMQQVREHYDIETLWCVGPELDDKTLEMTEVDEWQAMLAQHAIPVISGGNINGKAVETPSSGVTVDDNENALNDAGFGVSVAGGIPRPDDDGSTKRVDEKFHKAAATRKYSTSACCWTEAPSGANGDNSTNPACVRPDIDNETSDNLDYLDFDLDVLTSELESRILQAESRQHHDFIVKSAMAVTESDNDLLADENGHVDDSSKNN